MAKEFKNWGLLLLAVLAAGIARAQTASVPEARNPDWVSAAYADKVAPIFRQSCFACHGPQPQDTDHVLDPVAQKKMAGLIKGAKSRFPMFETFPFPGSGDPGDCLKRLVKMLRKKAAHPEQSKRLFEMGMPLSPRDRKTVLAWAEKSLTRRTTR